MFRSVVTVYFLIFVNKCECTTSNDTSQVLKRYKIIDTEHANVEVDLYYEVYQLKNMVKSMSDMMNKFNDYYNTRLEQKLSSMVLNMATVDSNVRNIQDRAHVWDTLQHHTSAWNEQIKSLDRKVDIISSGQEKIVLLDGKLSFMLNLEYNSQRALNKLSNLEDRFDVVEKSLKNRVEDRPSSLYEEFAARGALGALKDLEHKLDRTNLILHQFAVTRRDKRRFLNASEVTHRARTNVTCFLSSATNDLISDMSSKIDLIHDKVVSERDEDDVHTKEDTSNDQIDTDYSVEMYQLDDDDFTTLSKTGKKKIKETNHLRLDDIYEQLQQHHTTILNISEQLGNSFCNLDKKISRIQNETYIQNQELLRSLNDSLSKCKMNEGLEDNKTLPINRPIHIAHRRKYPRENFGFKEKEDEVQNIDSSEGWNSLKALENKITNCTDCDNVTISRNYTRYASIKDLVMYIVNISSTHMDLANYCDNPTFQKYCDSDDFLTIQSRVNYKENFTRSWQDYKWGFGDISSRNFWLGNEAIYCLTTLMNINASKILRIDLKYLDGSSTFAEYENFEIGDEGSFYELKVTSFEGNATDGLTAHANTKFSTFDVQNYENCCQCSNQYDGGWWFKSCSHSNLNGIYKGIAAHQCGMFWVQSSKQNPIVETRMGLKIKND